MRTNSDESLQKINPLFSAVRFFFCVDGFRRILFGIFQSCRKRTIRGKPKRTNLEDFFLVFSPPFSSFGQRFDALQIRVGRGTSIHSHEFRAFGSFGDLNWPFSKHSPCQARQGLRGCGNLIPLTSRELHTSKKIQSLLLSSDFEHSRGTSMKTWVLFRLTFLLVRNS